MPINIQYTVILPIKLNESTLQSLESIGLYSDFFFLQSNCRNFLIFKAKPTSKLHTILMAFPFLTLFSYYDPYPPVPSP